MKIRHSKHSSDDEVDPAIESQSSTSTSGGTSTNWKCPSCGAENEDFRKFCDGCGDKRPGATVATKGIAIEDLLGTGSSDDSSTSDDDTSKKSKGKKGKKNKKSDEDDDTLEPERLGPASSEPAPFQSAKTEQSDDFESKTTDDFGSKPSDDFGSKPSFVLTGPEPSPTSADDTSPKDSFSTFQPTSKTTTLPSPSSGSGFPSSQRYYMVFVNTPASSLIKTRVAIEFGDFPTVSIGRSPENIIVIPDPEVSRKHASLTLDGDRMTLKDLGSSNGSFIYNGKEFERVSDSVEVRPNSVLKFGTGTIVKLVAE
ncbi:MAG TPA: FHA domain-containing protein [Candidatus Dormibacteraeota bacterium]|jgi:pSer/pThr/pTyr-binding forkhead associated (FHA) protein|nr:FHA domain-containing protein [Candidatus Dormibacteraeota bacterium]